MNRHPPCTARLAVAGQDVNRPLLQIHLLPAQPCHLMRADSRVKHHPHRRRAAATLVLFRCCGYLLNLLRRENRHLLLHHSRRFHSRHGIRIAPAPLHGGRKHPTQNQPRLLPLPRCLKRLLNIPRTLLRSDATHPPPRQPRTPLHKPPRKIPEIIHCPRSPFFSCI